ncbi:MAG: TRAP transporter substrate-binding protein [Deltaproteobacteria bacterium]|nr:TRAP transporter substrate-binding protein [Deltaproteobacteria bacterium]
MRTKRVLGCLALGIIVCFLTIAPSIVQAKPVTLRLAHSEAVTNIRHDVCIFFVKRVAELSKGDVKIDIFPAGAMGSHQACQQQVATGVLDFYITTAGLVSTFDPTRIQELVELPYLFDNYSQAYAFMDTPYVAKFYDPLKAKGIHYLVTWDNGFRHLTNNVRPVYTPADMKGLKIRVVQSEMSINILQALGASAVPMSYAELYQAMQQKVVDGQENPFMNIHASKFYEVQKYMSLTKHQYSTLPIIISEMTWKRLDANQQNAIQKAAEEAAPYFRKLVGSSEDGQRKEMEKAGMKVNDVTDLAPFRKSVQVVYDWAKKKWGADKVSELLSEVEKTRKKYPVGGKAYFGPEDAR